MNLILTPENYNINYIYFNDSIKNTVIDNSNFIKIMFSNTDLYLNGFYMLITLQDVSLEKYYNKYKCVINEDNTNKVMVGEDDPVEYNTSTGTDADFYISKRHNKTY